MPFSVSSPISPAQSQIQGRAHGPRLSGGSFGNGNLCASRCANSGAFCGASGAERHGASAQVAAIRRQQPSIGRGTGNSAAGTEHSPSCSIKAPAARSSHCAGGVVIVFEIIVN